MVQKKEIPSVHGVFSHFSGPCMCKRLNIDVGPQASAARPSVHLSPPTSISRLGLAPVVSDGHKYFISTCRLRGGKDYLYLPLLSAPASFLCVFVWGFFFFGGSTGGGVQREQKHRDGTPGFIDPCRTFYKMADAEDLNPKLESAL